MRNNLTLCLVLLISTLTARAAEQTRYDSGEASDDEQIVLYKLNRARSDPDAESKRLEINLADGLERDEKARLKPRPPLAMNAKLLKLAREQSEDMHKRSFFEHKNPDGKGLVDRVKAAGYDYTYIAENIGASSKHSAAALQDLLIVDKDTPEFGHRKNMLGLLKDTSSMREIGVGFFAGAAVNDQGVRFMLTQQFGLERKSKAFIVGVVFKDANKNGVYDQGEGLSGVTINPDKGDYYAVTNAAGGFAVPIENGRVKLEVSGGEFEGTASASIKVKGENIEIDFVSGKTEPIVNFGKGEQ